MFEDPVSVLPLRRSTVLVVDDQATGRAILEQVVRGMHEPVAVESFARAVDAIVWATRHDADLVLVDYIMPDMDGIRFVNCLRALPGYEQVPVIMVTVSDDRDVRYAALDAGATDFLAKPIDARECLARCRNLLTLRRQQIALEHQTRRLEETMRDLRREWHARERDLALLPAHVAPFKPRKRNLSAPS
jgi:two-component system response regulator RpfG